MSAATSAAPSTTPDISTVTGHFVWEQLAALGTLVAIIVVAFLIFNSLLPVDQRGKRDPSFSMWQGILGQDGRASTSKTLALIWTIVLAFNLLTLTYIAASAPTGSGANQIPKGWADAAFKSLDSTYLAAVFGPLAAALLSKGIITTRVNSRKTLQKPASLTGPSAMDLIADDQGRLDLLDIQYCIFTLVTAVYVLTHFCKEPGQGIVSIPNTLAVLAGLSAAVFTGNKTVGSNPAGLNTILTPNVYQGGKVAVTGANLTLGLTGKYGDPKNAQVWLANVEEPSPREIPVRADRIEDDLVTFTVPVDTPAGDAWKLYLRTPLGADVSATGLNITAITAAPPTTSQARLTAAAQSANGVPFGANVNRA